MRRGAASPVLVPLAVVGIVALLVVIPAQPAAAVDRTFLVDSLSHQGDDQTPGNGICATSAGRCTLRAALQESNALGADDNVVIAPAADVDATTPGVQTTGTIVGEGLGPANMMFPNVLTTQGDFGAYFMATRSVTLDFQDRLGIASLNDANGATGIYINGPDVTVRNFSNIRSNETAIVIGPDGDRATIENGSSTDPGGINMERSFWLKNGANSVTIRNVAMGSPWGGGLGAIVIENGSTINDLTLDGIRMYDPDTEAYHGINVDGFATLNRLRIIGSTFEGFGGGSHVFDFREATINDAVISGNTFTRIRNLIPFTAIWINRQGTNNVISDNAFLNGPADVSRFAIFTDGMGLAASADSGWVIEDNYFDGWRESSVWLSFGTGILPVRRNTFGPLSFGGGTAANELDFIALVRNDGATANLGYATWFPTSVAVDSTACTLDVTVTPPTFGPVPATPVTIDVYFTATTKAEIHLGRQTGITAAGTITVPYSLGAGNIRVQTTAANGATSQYSRVIAQPAGDLCGPEATIDQAAGQADPTSVRDVLFTVQFSESIAEDLVPGDIDTTGSTAPETTVTGVTRTSPSSFTVTARADASGDIVLTLPAGAVSDAAGNASSASTSTDNVVSYVSPLSLTPDALTVTEGGATQGYVVANALAANAPITVTPSVGEPAWATATPAPLVLDTTAASGTVTVAAVDDTLVNGTRATTISHTVTSADGNFDGLLLAAVDVEILDDDQPDPANSDLVVTAGTKVADGSDPHTATVTLRNATGDLLAGVLATFQVDAGVVLTADLCTTAPGGTCSVDLTSTTAGTYEVRALVDGAEIGGSPASVEFVPGVPDPGTSTIEASPGSVVADGVAASTIAVTLRDANGNLIGAGGDTVTVGSSLGSLAAVVDTGDGTYTAALSSTETGTATVSFTVDGTASPNTATVEFLPGPADPATSTIEADPTSITADGESTSVVTVTLTDGFGNLVGAGGDDVAIATDAGTLTAVVDNGDGTYAAILTSSTVTGTATLTFNIEAVAASDTASVEFVAGAADPGTSTIAADPTSITADGASTSTVTVTLLDANGNPVGESAGTVTMATTAGALSPVTDHGDGTYTATLTAPTTTGTATVTFTLDGVDGTATATVDLVPGPPDLDTSTIAADPATLVADGASTSTVTVTLLDANGNPIGASAGTITMATTAGTLSEVSDNGDGTYTATLTSPATTSVPSATITYDLDGDPGARQAVVSFVPGAPDPGASTIGADPTSIVADGTSASTITVTLRDAGGSLVVDAGDVVTMEPSAGTLSDVIDNGDGTYTATVTAPVTAGNALVTFAVDGGASPNTATVAFVAGPPSPGSSAIAASPNTIPADGVSTSAITVQLFDANDNPLTSGGDDVAMATTAGTLSAVTDHGDGTYTATLTASTIAQTATISFTVAGADAPSTADVEFAASGPDPAQSTIAASEPVIEANGTDTSTITVTLRDAAGNQIPGGGDAVTITTTLGILTAVTDNGDGTYASTLTSDVAGTATLAFTVNGTAADDTVRVDVVDTTAPAPPVITSPRDGARAKPIVWVTGTGEPGATVSVTTDDGSPVCTAVVAAAGAWSCLPEEPLPEGEMTLIATQTDASGNASGQSEPVTITVDGSPPPPPLPDPTNGLRITGTSEPGTTVTIADPSGTIVCVAVTEDSGRFECIPGDPIPLGTLLTLTATDAAGNTSVISMVRVGGASVTLDLDPAEPGDTQVARGRGFLPGEPVSGLLESTPLDLGTLPADGNGSVTFTIVLPADVAPGTHRLTLTGPDSGSVWAEFQVSEPTATTTPPDDPDLPRTGAPLLRLAGTGLLLILLGAVLLVAIAERRR